MSNNWEGIKPLYEAGERSLRDIAGEFGVSEGAIRKQAKARGWVRNTGTQVPKSTHKSTQEKKQVRTKEKVRTSKEIKKETNSISEGMPAAKRKGNPAPVRMFKLGNTAAMKHSAYSRRMILSDDVIEDAREMTLADELFRLRAANVMASDTIARLKVELEEVNPDKERRDAIEAIIRAAEAGMARNTNQMVAIEGTMASITKMAIDCNYREKATEKVIAEIDVMKGGDAINATVVHNALPMPAPKPL